MKARIIYLLCVIFLLVATSTVVSGSSKSEKDFRNARKEVTKQKWEKASEKFAQFIKKYPEDEHLDGAMFWLGYSVENLEDGAEEAFSIFTDMTENYPESPWADNAMVHQINIAEAMVRNGNEEYRPFLNSMLSSDVDEVRFRAAIALGKLGDDSVTAILYEARQDEQHGFLATDVLRSLKTGETLENIQASREIEQPPVSGSFLTPKRYKQYQSMLRKDDSWTRQELLKFGMWHVLPTKLFEEYATLNDVYDQLQWYDDYWKQLAAHLDLPEFEVRSEFERRVFFARGNYSKTGEHLSRKYLSNQYLMEDKVRAPWDARGELMIKYGEPDRRELGHDGAVYEENWDYEALNVDFTVKQHYTNINNTAIRKGPVYNPLYDYNNAKFYSDFIQTYEFRWNINQQTIPFTHLKVDIEEVEAEDGNISLSYMIPTAEFALVSFDRKKHAISLRGLYILDEDEQEVYSDELKKTFRVNKEGQAVGETLKLSLEPGTYKIFLRVEDYASYRSGRYEEEIQVEIHSKS